MDPSEDSNLEGGLTPIRGSPLSNYGQEFSSDSPPELSPIHRRQQFWSKSPERRKKYGRRQKKTEVSFQLVDSGEGKTLNQEYLNGIYEELQAISEKLKEENKMLYEREQKLKERERMLSVSHSNLQTITNHQTRQQVAAIQQKYLEQIAYLEQSLKEKTKENSRLKENFDMMKQANDTLKKEMGILHNQNEKLNKQNLSLQARLTNLQKKQEFEQRQRDGEVNIQQVELNRGVRGSGRETEEKITKPRKPKSVSPPVLDITSVLLEWVCEAHLRQSVTDQPTQPAERFAAPNFLQDKVLRVLPSLVDILRESQMTNVKHTLPCLQFVYWSLMLLEQASGQQKASLSSTIRRLGEEIYRPKSVRGTEDAGSSASLSGGAGEALRDNIFLRSHNQHIRLLSAIIILKSLSQADILAQAFDVLKVELKSEVAKELFLYYQATPTIVHYLKPVNKAFMGTAVDIFLQLSTDSPFQASFLESCSNEGFFRTAAMVIRTPLSDARIMERLSIILQKLSKIRHNKKYFEVYTIVSIIQELLRSCGNENAFLALNLKSILFNLNAAVTER